MEKKLILVVENDPTLSKYMVKHIDSLGPYQAVPAYNGAEAIDTLQANQYGSIIIKNKIKCILLDWQMPKMNGEQFIRTFRNDEHKNIFKQSLPIIVISVHSDEKRRGLAIDPYFGRVSAYLVKPYDKAQLENYLNEIVLHGQSDYLREKLQTQIECLAC